MSDVRLIDANALKSKLYSLLKLEGASPVFIEGLEFALAVADVAPIVDAVPVVHGRWVHSDGKSIVWYCSECGGKILYNPNPRTYNIKKPKIEQYNKFCRNCGAKMDGGAQ